AQYGKLALQRPLRQPQQDHILHQSEHRRRPILTSTVLTPSAPAKGHLLRVLGVSFGVAVSVGGTIGAGILRTPGTVAAQLRSAPLMMLAWFAGGIYALVCTISVSELATAVPEEGGWCVFARRAFGGYGGFLAGYSDLLVQTVALAYVSTAAGEFAIALLPSISIGSKTIAI